MKASYTHQGSGPPSSGQWPHKGQTKGSRQDKALTNDDRKNQQKQICVMYKQLLYTHCKYCLVRTILAE